MEVGGSAERKEVCFRGESVGFVKIDNGHKHLRKVQTRSVVLAANCS
jgi:hypothetical protein